MEQPSIWEVLGNDKSKLFQEALSNLHSVASERTSREVEPLTLTAADGDNYGRLFFYHSIYVELIGDQKALLAYDIADPSNAMRLTMELLHAGLDHYLYFHDNYPEDGKFEIQNGLKTYTFQGSFEEEDTSDFLLES